jgi:hypothetical protein
MDDGENLSSGQLQHRIYFWLGKKAPVDKIACVAIHSVNLRQHLSVSSKDERIVCICSDQGPARALIKGRSALFAIDARGGASRVSELVPVILHRRRDPWNRVVLFARRRGRTPSSSRLPIARGTENEASIDPSSGSKLAVRSSVRD